MRELFCCISMALAKHLFEILYNFIPLKHCMFQILQSEKKKEMTLLCKKKNHGKRDFY